MRIKSITNRIRTIGDRKNPFQEEQVNQITVEFDKFKTFRMDSIALETEKGEKLDHIDSSKCVCVDAITNPTPSFLFAMDECELLDGAKITILLKNPVTEKEERFIWVLKDGQWSEEKHQVWDTKKNDGTYQPW